MNHAITIGGLFGTLGILVGLAVTFAGAVVFFAGSMSDAPVEGEAAGKQGCIMFAVGAAVVIGSLWALL